VVDKNFRPACQEVVDSGFTGSVGECLKPKLHATAFTSLDEHVFFQTFYSYFLERSF
jgi:hypothetical protein